MPDAPAKKPPTCGNCPYYEGRKTTGAQDTGICRKNAPRHSTASFYLWPEVRGIDWCGQHPAIEFLAQQKMVEMLANGGVDMLGDLFDKVKERLP